jgi:hypothetical protein
VRLIDVKRAPELLDAARGQERGSPELRDLSAMADLLEAARTSSRRRAPECFICGKHLGARRIVSSMLLVRGACDYPVIFALGICWECVAAVGGHNHLRPKILPVLRQISPGLRDIHVIDAAGQA